MYANKLGTLLPFMLDANNGYNLNLARRVLAATADCGIFWLEEAFHEDDVLYRDLRAWLAEQGLPTLIADGEGQADPRLVRRAGAIRGFTYVEWDEATTEGLDTAGYTIDQGYVVLPSAPGFGLALDEDVFQRAVAHGGVSYRL